ncbi:MAG: hypothetical protein KC457_21650, partial [Myxococcales bacterium]|nr:hypothetical protein [Myxococcales bacterium]
DTTDTTDTTDTGGELCAADPNDDMCDACVKDSCCMELEACVADEDCTCLLGCFGMGGSPQQCFGQCGVMQPPATFLAFGGCIQDSCANQCGG